jgi:hypothetical protein
MRPLRRVVASLVCGAGLLCLAGSPAHAGSILLFEDFSFSSSGSFWGTALMGLGRGVTSVTDDAVFATLLTSNPWDLVVVQFNAFSHPTAASALSSYVSTGGKAIFSHWLPEADPAFGVTQANTNLQRLTVGPLFSAGIFFPGTQTVSSRGLFSIYSRSFVPDVDTTVAGTFEDGNAAIVIGNDGRTIINGFLGGTVNLPEDEVTIYHNEANSLLEPVPEPTTLFLFGTTAAGLGLARRRHQRRRQAAAGQPTNA